MKDYLIGVTASIIFFTLASLILPKDKFGAYVKGVFATVVALIILTPLTNVDFSQPNVSFTSSDNEQTYCQQSFLQFIGEEKIKEKEVLCEKIFKNSGFDDVEIDIDYTISDYGEEIIKSVSVFLTKSVITDEQEHIDIIDKNKTSISDYLNVDKEVVKIIYGKD